MQIQTTDPLSQNGQNFIEEQTAAKVQHPFQTLAMAGNVLGSTKRNSIPNVQFELQWNSSERLCSDFDEIVDKGYGRLAISTEAADLGSGYRTVSWKPDFNSLSGEPYLVEGGHLDENDLHSVPWISQVGDLSFQYNVTMVSNVEQGRINSCSNTPAECSGSQNSESRWSHISEFAQHDRFGFSEGSEVSLLGPQAMYQADNSPDYERYMPNYWLFQFLNIVRKDDQTFMLYFRPQNVWVRTDIPDARGFLVWNISDQQKQEFASCWLSEPGFDFSNFNYIDKFNFKKRAIVMAQTGLHTNYSGLSFAATNIPGSFSAKLSYADGTPPTTYNDALLNYITERENEPLKNGTGTSGIHDDGVGRPM